MPKDLDLNEVLESVTEVKKIFETFKEKVDGQTEELKKGFDDVVRREELDKINKAIDTHQDLIDAAHLRMKRMATAGDGATSEESLEAKALEFGKLLGRESGEKISEFSVEDQKNYETALGRYFRKGEKVLEPEQFKALSVGGDPDGGYVVHPDMSGRIVERIYETSPVRQYASQTTISTDALEGIHDVDEAAANWVSERGARSETDTPELDVWRIPVHELYAMPYATQKIVDDAAINIETWLAGKVANKMSRIENAAFVNGDGVGKPRGFLTYADYAVAGTDQIGRVEQFDTGVNGDFAADPNGPDVLYNCIYGMKAAYLSNAVWMMNRTTVGRVRKMQDSNGMYMWQPSVAAGQPSTLAGYALAPFEDMPAYTGTGNLAIAFGDLGAAYQIVDRMGIRVLRDPYSAKPYIQYYTTKRVGGDVVDFAALKLIKFSA